MFTLLFFMLLYVHILDYVLKKIVKPGIEKNNTARQASMNIKKALLR